MQKHHVSGVAPFFIRFRVPGLSCEDFRHSLSWYRRLGHMPCRRDDIQHVTASSIWKPSGGARCFDTEPAARRYMSLFNLSYSPSPPLPSAPPPLFFPVPPPFLPLSLPASLALLLLGPSFPGTFRGAATLEGRSGDSLGQQECRALPCGIAFGVQATASWISCRVGTAGAMLLPTLFSLSWAGAS